MDHYQQASRVLADVLAKKGSIKTLALAKDIRNKVRKSGQRGKCIDLPHRAAARTSPLSVARSYSLLFSLHTLSVIWTSFCSTQVQSALFVNVPLSMNLVQPIPLLPCPSYHAHPPIQTNTLPFC